MRNPIASAVRQSPYTSTEMARRLGMPQPTFADRMRGRTRWTLADARAIAGILGVSLDDLVTCPPAIEPHPAVPA